MENIFTLITDGLKNLSEIVRNTPETIKIAAAVAPPGLSLLGASIEEWSFILACIVSIVVIIEKLPVVIKRATSFVEWMKNALRKR